MRNLFLASSTALTVLTAHAVEAPWTDDFQAAKATAAEQGKDVLLEFTGSDWCPPCIALDREVFQHEEFKQRAPEDFVLVKLDFPPVEGEIDQELEEPKDRLYEKYGVQGFPTLVLTDAKGRPFAFTSYQPGGPEAYLDHLETLRARKQLRDEAFARAGDLEGLEKAQVLVEALRTMGLREHDLATFYPDVFETVLAADPEDKTGFLRDLKARRMLAELPARMEEAGSAGGVEAVIALFDEMIDSGQFVGAPLQELLLRKGLILANSGSLDEAAGVFDKAKAVDPDSEIGSEIDRIMVRLEEKRSKTVAPGPHPEP